MSPAKTMEPAVLSVSEHDGWHDRACLRLRSAFCFAWSRIWASPPLLLRGGTPRLRVS